MFWNKKDRAPLSEATIRSALGDPDWLSGLRLADGGRVILIVEGDPDNLEAAETRKIEAEARAIASETRLHDAWNEIESLRNDLQSARTVENEINLVGGNVLFDLSILLTYFSSVCGA